MADCSECTHCGTVFQSTRIGGGLYTPNYCPKCGGLTEKGDRLDKRDWKAEAQE